MPNDNDWKKIAGPVESSLQLCDSLRSQLVDDLDEQNGGLRTLAGQGDARAIALISDYVISSVAGVSQSLLHASLQVWSYRQNRFIDNNWLVRTWTAVAESNPRANDDDFLAAQRRGPHEEVRSLEISLAAEHFFYHLAQGLDRLSASIIGVAGLDSDLLRADWSDITRAMQRSRNGAGKPLAPVGSAGRDAQAALLTTVEDCVAAGPNDWLEWAIRLRDTNAHRAPQMGWMFLTADNRRATGIAEPFYRQPGWSSNEAMVANAETGDRWGLFLKDDPAELMARYVDQMSNLASVAIQALADLWAQRLADPGLITQPAGQWNLLAQRRLNFDGFGDSEIQVFGDKLFVSPRDARRLKAAKVMDGNAEFWLKQT